MSPTRKRVGKTVLGVRIGCQAFNRCCLNAVSDECVGRSQHRRKSQRQRKKVSLAGRFEPLFCFPVPSSSFSGLSFFGLRLKRPILGVVRRALVGSVIMSALRGGRLQVGFADCSSFQAEWGLPCVSTLSGHPCLQLSFGQHRYKASSPSPKSEKRSSFSFSFGTSFPITPIALEKNGLI